MRSCKKPRKMSTRRNTRRKSVSQSKKKIRNRSSIRGGASNKNIEPIENAKLLPEDTILKGQDNLFWIVKNGIWTKPFAQPVLEEKYNLQNGNVPKLSANKKISLQKSKLQKISKPESADTVSHNMQKTSNKQESSEHSKRKSQKTDNKQESAENKHHNSDKMHRKSKRVSSYKKTSAAQQSPAPKIDIATILSKLTNIKSAKKQIINQIDNKTIIEAPKQNDESTKIVESKEWTPIKDNFIKRVLPNKVYVYDF